jgi:hypothetical protein
LVVVHGEAQTEDRAPLAVAAHADLSAVLAHDLLRDREAHLRPTRPLAGEGHEDLLE